MLVQLTVVNEEDEASSASDYLFEGDRITIGRGDENDLRLADPKRIVSTEHAAVRREETGYCLVDRGSKNFTYVGEQRITSQDSYELSDGDVFQIGDFRIEFRTLESGSSPLGGDETVFDTDFVNPFEAPAARLAGAIDDLAETYDDVAPQRREDALIDALGAVDRLPTSSGALGHLRAWLEDRGASDGPDEAAVSPSWDGSSSPSEGDLSSPHVRAGEEGEGASPVQAVLDVLSSAVATVVPIPWRFRHEFIGQTVMQAPETQFLYSGAGETIKEHLLDPSLAPEDREQRLGYVEDAAETLLVHQIAMLNGYKASVMDGAKALLDRLDPEAHRTAVETGNPLFKYVPVAASPGVLDRVQAEWDDLHREEGAIAEERVFRPAFTKAYLARMTAPPAFADASSEDAP